MPWFIGQSWLIIILSFLVGLLLGWALWRRPWHKRYHSESEAITRVTRDHTKTLSAKDAEITRLRGLLDERGAAAAGATGAVAAQADTVTAEDAEDAAADGGEAAVETGAMDQQALTDAAAAAPVAESSESVDIADVDAPAVAVDEEHHALDVHEIDTPDVDVSDDATATAQISGLTSSTEAAPAEAAPAEAVEAVEAAPVESAPVETATDEVGANGADAGEGAAVAAAAASEGEDDDLERVEGIGPRIGAALRAAGITTFENLATSDVAKLQSALEAAGLRFAPSLPTWARQARLLADGDEEGFLKLTEQLVGGRDIGRRA